MTSSLATPLSSATWCCGTAGANTCTHAPAFLFSSALRCSGLSISRALRSQPLTVGVRRDGHLWQGWGLPRRGRVSVRFLRSETRPRHLFASDPELTGEAGRGRQGAIRLPARTLGFSGVRCFPGRGDRLSRSGWKPRTLWRGGVESRHAGEGLAPRPETARLARKAATSLCRGSVRPAPHPFRVTGTPVKPAMQWKAFQRWKGFLHRRAAQPETLRSNTPKPCCGQAEYSAAAANHGGAICSDNPLKKLTLKGQSPRAICGVRVFHGCSDLKISPSARVVRADPPPVCGSAILDGRG